MKICVNIHHRATIVSRIKDGVEVGSIEFSPGGVELAEALVESVKETQQLAIPRLSADWAILKIGAVMFVETPVLFKIKGRSTVTGQPASSSISTNEICAAIVSTFNKIIPHVIIQVKHFLEHYSDIEDVIIFTGDYKHMPGAREALETAINLETTSALSVVVE